MYQPQIKHAILSERNRLNRQMTRTTIVGFIRALCAILIYFLLTPFVLRILGSDYYGIWSLSGVILTIFSLSDFGFQNSVVHFTAMSLNDHAKLVRLFNTVYFLFLGLAIAFLAFILVPNDFIVTDILRVGPKYLKEARFMITCSAVVLSLGFLTARYEAIIQGNQRVYYTQIVSFAWLLFNAAATYLSLRLVPCVYSLGVVSVLGGLLLFSPISLMSGGGIGT